MNISELHKASLGDVELAYRVYGEGQPLIFVMGYTGTMDLWDPHLIAALAARYDHRGIGLSTAPARDFTIEDLTEDLRGLMDALDVPSAHLLGWSMGTYVAQEMALGHPDRVNKLILFAGDCGADEAVAPAPEVWQVLEDALAMSRPNNSALLRFLFPQEWLRENHLYLRNIFKKTDVPPAPDTIRRQAAAWKNWRGSATRLFSIRARTLVITGSDDIVTPSQNSVMLASMIPDAKLVELKGAGHGAIYQFPAEFSKAVIDFLAE